MLNQILTFICILVISHGLWSQQDMEQEFENAYALLNTNRDSAIGLIDNFDLSVLPKEEQALFHKQAAEFFGILAVFPKQAFHYKALIDILPENSDTSYYYYRFLALSQLNSGDFEASLGTLRLANIYYENRHDVSGLVATYNGLGSVYTQLGELEKAINYFLYAIKICDKQNNLTAKVRVLGNLGIAYRSAGEYDKVLMTFLETYEIVKKTGDQAEIKFTELGIGGAYNNLGKHDSAIFYLEPLQSYYQENFNAQMLNAIYNELGRAYSSINQNDKAEEYYLKSIALLRDGGFDFAMPGTLANYGMVLYAKGDFKKGIRVCQEALPIARRIEYLEVRMIVCECLYKNFKGAEISDSALYYLEKKLVLQDSLSNIDLQKSVLRTELNAKHDSEKQSLKRASDSEINQVKSYSVLLIVACALLILGFLFLYFVYRQRKKANESISQEKEYLDNLLHNLVHEFRTPLTLIKGPVEELLKHDSQNRLLNMVNRNSDQMLNLVNQVLDFAKIKAGKLEVTRSITDLNVFLADVYNLFLPLANARGIKLELQNSISNSVIAIDSDKLFKIISNFISNAIKYSEENGHVIIAGSEKNNYYTFEVVDNGIGISTRNLQRIFEKFYQVDATLTRKGEGTGLGLAFAKELAELMNGKISIESVLNKGTKIRFEIKAEIVKSSPAVLSRPKNTEGVPNEATDHIQAEEDACKILIIEDNRDMQLFLQELMLREGYEVFFADNGKIGIEKGLDCIPDLIITDVMMPVMDGFQVVQEMKSNEKTDHIPILVLTAKASFDSKLEGLTYGADDYISKPFSSDELMLRVKNQLSRQEKLRSKYGNTKEKIIPELEENKFLLKIKEFMQADFSVQISAEEMAEKCAMSRSQLHRKLIALTGMSASALFTKIRLEFAREDILKTDLSISEIAYKFGYSDPARFSKVFKKEYNSTPSDLRQ